MMEFVYERGKYARLSIGRLAFHVTTTRWQTISSKASVHRAFTIGWKRDDYDFYYPSIHCEW